MRHKFLQTIATILFLVSALISKPLPNWADMIVNESQMPAKGDDFTEKAYQFIQNRDYKNFHQQTGVAGKTMLLKGGILIANNKTYLTPEFIPTNVDMISKYDIIKVYTLFNVVYYVEKIDQDINAILNDISTPPVMQTVQGTILTCVYNKKIIQQETFSIYIYGNNELADNFKYYNGQPVGSSVLNEIKSGNTLPETPPSVLIISGDSGNFDEIIQYGKDNNILTITDKPELLKKGITIGIGQYADDVKILLNTRGVYGSDDSWNSDTIFYKKL